MKIIDAQVHIWGSGTPSGDHRQVPVFTAEELLQEMAEAGVEGAVLHPPVSWDPDANAISEAAAARYPGRFCVLGQVPLDTPEASRPLLATWRQRPGQCGLRYPFVREDQQSWPFDGTIDWLWPAAEEAGLPVATMAWRFLPEFARIAERRPDVPVVPVYTHGLGKALPKGEWMIVPFFVDIFVGEPLAFEGDRAAYMDRYRAAMAALALEEKHADWS